MPSYGTVTVYAYTSIARIPIEGAEVTVTEGEHDSPVLHRETTDRSGSTPALPLETPAGSESTSPSGQTPFRSVGITIRRAGYGTRSVSGVQVFPGTQTLQGFAMIPLLPSQEDEITRTETPAQDL